MNRLRLLPLLLLPLVGWAQINQEPLQQSLNTIRMQISTDAVAETYTSAQMRTEIDEARGRLAFVVPLATFHNRTDTTISLNVAPWFEQPPAAPYLTIYLPLPRGEMSSDKYQSRVSRELPAEIYLGEISFDIPVTLEGIFVEQIGALIFNLTGQVDLRRALGTTYQPALPQTIDLVVEGARLYDLPE
ncbi:MAG: hypothetical protein WBA12_04035 [Catalinimonas sp.]